MADPTRYFLAGLQNEGERARRGRFQQPVLAIVDAGIGCQFTQVAAQQGQVVFLIDTTDTAQVVCRRLVVDLANQGITGVGRHRDHSPLFQQCNGLFQESDLWILRVNFKVLRHAIEFAKPVAPTPV